jgi:hypothetical protein
MVVSINRDNNLKVSIAGTILSIYLNFYHPKKNNNLVGYTC